MDALSTFAPPHKQGNPKTIEPLKQKAKVIVIGAGVFGSWTALQLLRKGFEVVLTDMWGPGNSRSTSGGESRLIRSFYGTNKSYFEMAVESWDHWKSLEKDTGRKLLHHTGVLWLFNRDNSGVLKQMTSIMDEFNQPYKVYPPKVAENKFPQINFSDIEGVLIEKSAGYLEAKNATIATRDQFVKEGGQYFLGKCVPGVNKNGYLKTIDLDGRMIEGDAFIFACGPWLREIFPEILRKKLAITRQEVYYFGIPSNKSNIYHSLIPWIDWVPGEFYYGIPGIDNRGFKIAYDKRGAEFDPTSTDRVPEMELVNRSRKYLAKRFPALKDAPLIESRICQYSNSPDGNFIFDIHPDINNVWILGGGSGHGFKHGPAVGKMASDVLSGRRPLPTDYIIFYN